MADSDLFFIPVADGVVAYAPLRHLCVKMTQEEYENEAARERILSENLFLTSTISQGAGVMGFGEFSLEDAEYLTIGLTSACNLRCAYCYANGGDYSVVMSPRLLDASLDLAEACFKKHGRLGVCFMGDGETLTVKDAFFASCERLRAISPDIQIQLITNGTLITEEIAQHLKALAVDVQISYDPLSETRPFADGSSSTSSVEAAFGLLAAAGVDVYVRSTIIPETAHLMPDMVRHLASIAPSLRGAMFEPVGLCSKNNETFSATDFTRPWIEALAVAKTLGLHLNTSGYRHELKRSPAFCGTATPSVTIVASGIITSCSRATREGQEVYSDQFIFGRYREDYGQFIIDQEKVDALRRNTIVSAYPECDDCAARLHCAGGCPIKRAAGENNCELNYTLFVFTLLEMLEGGYFVNQNQAKKVVHVEAPMGFQVMADSPNTFMVPFGSSCAGPSADFTLNVS